MEYTIAKMISDLVILNDEQWGKYAFYHEPLERKFTKEQKETYIVLANACGKEEAIRIKNQYPKQDIFEIARMLEFDVEMSEIPTGGGRVLFAQYIEPKKITIFNDCIIKAESLIKKENLWGYLQNLSLKEALLAHELFHGIEFRKKKEIFTQTEKIELWRKPFSNKSRILCLSEIAAMAFAKEMIGINFSPYILDVLLMYSYNQEAACALYDEILEAVEIRERQEE